LPNAHDKFILDTDASDTAIGAELSQIQNGEERVIVYGSFTLDHSSLQWLVNFKEPQGQLARWLEVLNQYNMTIQHRAGKQHTNADALSRLETDKPCKEM
jgi:hypothetical protein